MFVTAKKLRIVYVPLEPGIEVLYGNVKQAIIQENGERTTEQSYYVVINLSRRYDSIEVKKYSHGKIWDRKYSISYNSEGKRAKMVGYLDVEYESSAPHDSAYKMRSQMLSKQVSEIYEYAKNGYIAKCILEPADLSGESYVYKYNSKGDMIESDYYLNPKVIMEVNKFIYDSRHLVVEEKSFHNNTLMHQTNYSYFNFDPENNWTKRQDSYDGRTITITRKITYY